MIFCPTVIASAKNTPAAIVSDFILDGTESVSELRYDELLVGADDMSDVQAWQKGIDKRP